MTNPLLVLEMQGHLAIKAELLEIRSKWGDVSFSDDQKRAAQQMFEQFEDDNSRSQVVGAHRRGIKKLIDQCQTDLGQTGSTSEGPALAVSLYLRRYPEGNIFQKVTGLADFSHIRDRERVQKTVAWIDYYFGFGNINTIVPAAFSASLIGAPSLSRLLGFSVDFRQETIGLSSTPVQRVEHVAIGRRHYETQAALLKQDPTGRELIQAYMDGFADPPGVLGPVRYYPFQTKEYLQRGAQFAQRTYNACYDIATSA